MVYTQLHLNKKKREFQKPSVRGIMGLEPVFFFLTSCLFYFILLHAGHAES